MAGYRQWSLVYLPSQKELGQQGSTTWDHKAWECTTAGILRDSTEEQQPVCTSPCGSCAVLPPRIKVSARQVLCKHDHRFFTGWLGWPLCPHLGPTCRLSLARVEYWHILIRGRNLPGSHPCLLGPLWQGETPGSESSGNSQGGITLTQEILNYTLIQLLANYNTINKWEMFPFKSKKHRKLLLSWETEFLETHLLKLQFRVFYWILYLQSMTNIFAPSRSGI